MYRLPIVTAFLVTATLLHAAGEKREYFGVRDAMLKGAARGDGPLEALLA